MTFLIINPHNLFLFYRRRKTSVYFGILIKLPELKIRANKLTNITLIIFLKFHKTNLQTYIILLHDNENGLVNIKEKF